MCAAQVTKQVIPGGRGIKAVIQLKPASQATEDDIIQLVKRRLGSVHAPKTVDFVASLPRSPNGKVELLSGAET
ncbi:MAG TPA: hypothetical protein VFK10_09610 [Burkholderiaceae bacterium]|nr:hypothetical protein [Burkholderiaceae bacterium]